MQNSLNTNRQVATIIEAIQDKKGHSICDIDLSDIHAAPSSRFIICQGKTPTQTSAIADNIIERMRENEGRKPITTEGYRNGQWIIIDYGDVMIHVFMPEFREFYNLEDLWNDGRIFHVPDLD